MAEQRNDKVLVLFTSTYPYGGGEQFIETEIKFLSRAYSEVHIYPLTLKGVAREVPANVRIIKPDLYHPYSRVRLFFKHLFVVMRVFAIELSRGNHRKKHLMRIPSLVKFLLNRLNDAAWLETQLAGYDMRKTTIYSYWFNHWVFLLSLIRFTRNASLSFITRIHQGDYEEETRRDGYFPFRNFELGQLHAIYPVSEYGANYIRSRYPHYRNLLQVSRLGVSDKGTSSQSNGQFHLVSCSFLTERKRVHLIVQILRHVNFKVHWTHFGDGELMAETKEMVRNLGSNITTDFRGHVPNNEVLEFYAEQPVDMFINTSAFEGIPVSMMEAISFGIPLTGCAICGVPEIVTKETGILLDKDFDPKEAAARITAYYTLTREEKETFRERVKQFWNAHFNADRNYPAFITDKLNTE